MWCLVFSRYLEQIYILTYLLPYLLILLKQTSELKNTACVTCDWCMWYLVFSHCVLSCTRTCLRYFLPPQWVMDKDSVSGLSFEELASFPLEDFFDHYERGLKKVILFLCSVVLLIASTLLIISVCWECFCDFLQLQMCRTFTKSLPVVVSLKWIVKWTIHESSVVTHTCATDKGQLSCAYKVRVETNGWTRPNLWPSLLMWLVINCIVGVQVIVTCQVQKQMKEVNGENSHLNIMCFHDKWISHLLLAASDVSIVKCLFISNWYIYFSWWVVFKLMLKIDHWKQKRLETNCHHCVGWLRDYSSLLMMWVGSVAPHKPYTSASSSSRVAVID